MASQRKHIETPFTYTNFYSPDRYECVPRPGQVLVDRIRKDFHLAKYVYGDRPLVGRPIVMRCEAGHFPELPKNKDVIDEDVYPRYGFEEVYVHVYGLYNTYHVKLQDDVLKDIDLMDNLRNEEMCSDFVRQDFCLGNKLLSDGFIGAKLVYKKPPTSTVLGEVPMIKLYFGPEVSTYSIKKEIATNSTMLKGEVFDALISSYTQWLISEKASAIGQMWIKSSSPLHPTTFVDDGYEYKYIDVHYKDVIFDNDNKYDLSKHDFSDLINIIRTKTTEDVDNPVTLKFIELQTKGMEDLCFGDNESLKIFKKKIIQHVMRCVQTSRKDVYKNGYGSSQLYAYALGVVKDLFPDMEYDDMVTNYVVPFRFHVMKFQYQVGTLVKDYWRNCIQKQYFTDQKRDRQDALLQKIGQRLRVCAFDIETYYKAHSDESNKMIISIHATLYNESAHNVPMENVQFVVLSKQRQGQPVDISLEEMAADVESAIGGGGNLKPGENFNLVFRDTEKEMLIEFMNTVRKWKVNVLTHYNGDSFDLPFVQKQLEEHYLFGCRPYTQPAGYRDDGQKIRRKFYNGMSFSNKPDRASITYKKEGKIAETKLRAKGVGKYVTKIAEEMYNNAYETEFATDEPLDKGEEQERFFYDEEQGFAMDERMQEMAAAHLVDSEGKKKDKEVYNHMLAAWDIQNLCMKNTGSRDVMKCVPNEPFYKDPNTPFDKKLDSVAFGFLNLRKAKCEEVEYENMAKTWESGDLYKLILYNIIDTLLVFKLDRLLKNGVKDIARARRAFKPMRELYGNKTQECTLSMMYSYLWYYGAVSHDPNVFKNEMEFWEPEFEYDNDTCFWRVPCKAGRTITGCEGVYNGYVTTLSDFVSQYSTIMDGRNICTSTIVKEKDLKPNWIEGVHYTRIRVPNSIPHVYHACNPDSEKCTYKKMDDDARKTREQRKKEYCAGCVWKHTFKPVAKDIYFVTEKVMPAIAKLLSKDLREERAMYKKLKAGCASGDPNKIVYDIAQLDAKLAGNSIYGVMLRINSEVGGAITETGRTDNESATLLLSKLSGPASMCDTDSTSSINRYWSLNPARVPDHRVSDEKLNKMYEYEPFRELFEKGPYTNPPINREGDNDKTEGALNRLCKLLFPDRWAKHDLPTIREIFTKMFDHYENIMDMLNKVCVQ